MLAKIKKTTNTDYKKIADLYKQIALNKLSAYGIRDNFVIKVKDQPKDWVAQYRSLSQFKNNGRGPIFWISPELIFNESEFVLSILHEYGHVIAEYAYISEYREHNQFSKQTSGKIAIAKFIKKYWGNKYNNKYWDEEEFAEDFARFVYGITNKNKTGILSVIKAYIND